MRGSSHPVTSPLLDQLEQPPLAQHRVRELQLGELDLLRAGREVQLLDAPVVERAVVLELERAQRVRDALDRVGQAVGEVVHRVDAPRVAGPVVVRVLDAVRSAGRAC
jgi:hypothetical protein